MKKIFITVPIIIAIGIFIALVKTKEEPKKHKVQNYKNVSVQIIDKKDVLLSINSFGTVKPKVDLNIKSAVSGHIVYINPKLKNGNFIKKDEVLLRVDSKEYELNIKSLEAEILRVEANIKELEKEIENAKTLLIIENKRLTIEKTDFKRYKKTKQFVSEQTITKYENIVLARQNSIENLNSKLRTLPLKIKSQQSNIKVLNSKKDIAKIAFDDCVIRMPIDGIVYEKSVEKDEFISKGKKLLKLFDKNKMEIEVDIPVTKLKRFTSIDSIKDLRAQFYSSSLNKYFKGSFSRLAEGVDEKTRTLKLIFTLEGTILKGLFLDVKIFANEIKGAITIPKDSYHNGLVYLVENERLKFKKVDILYEDRDFYVISGINEKDTLITSNIKSAIEGMRVKVIR